MNQEKYQLTLFTEQNLKLPESCCDLGLWEEQEALVALNGGRGGSIIFNIGDDQYVFRHYLRGGMIAQWLKDQYVWTGLKSTRPYREYKVTQYALDKGLPVAQCVACCTQRTGLFYRASLIMKFIPNQGTLADVLFREALSEDDWTRLAHVIKKMHGLGIDHKDLNADNILVSEDMQFSIIDFDKAVIHSAKGKWAQDNIQRLLRSFNKLQPKYFTQDQWNVFYQAYQAK